MLAILGSILGFVSGPLTSITNQIIALEIQKSNATTDQQKIAADEAVATLQAQRDVLVAEGGTHFNQIVRLLFVFPCAVYINKVLLWDKILSPTSTTEDLSNNLWWIVFSVVGFFFLSNMSAVWARK